MASAHVGTWCNGSTLVFGTSCRGSNPCVPARDRRASRLTRASVYARDSSHTRASRAGTVYNKITKEETHHVIHRSQRTHRTR